MECNNILLDYYKQKRGKTRGIEVPSCWVQVKAGVLRAGCVQQGGSGLCGLAGASGWPRLAREAPSAGDAQLGVLSPLSLFSRHFTRASASPRKAAGSDHFCFTSVVLFWFVLYLGTLWCQTCHSGRGNHITIEPLLKEIILDTWENSCKALSDFQCIYFIHVILEVFLLWGMGMAVSVFESGQYKRKIISEMLSVLGRPQYSRNILFLYSAVPLTGHSLGFVLSFCVERQMGLVLNSKIFKV